MDSISSFYNLVLTTALAFLLVFRLNRVAIRWWDTRMMWGTIVADARTLTDLILEHVSFAYSSTSVVYT
jgi:predicted membrane chloride channel (bestrophin family)